MEVVFKSSSASPPALFTPGFLLHDFTSSYLICVIQRSRNLHTFDLHLGRHQECSNNGALLRVSYYHANAIPLLLTTLPSTTCLCVANRRGVPIGATTIMLALLASIGGVSFLSSLFNVPGADPRISTPVHFWCKHISLNGILSELNRTYTILV